MEQPILAKKKNFCWRNWEENLQKGKIKDTTIKRWEKRKRFGKKFAKIQLPKPKRNQTGHESDPRNVVKKEKLVEEKLLPPQVE